MSSIISLLPFDLYKLYSMAVEVYYALRAFALTQPDTVNQQFYEQKQKCCIRIAKRPCDYALFLLLNPCARRNLRTYPLDHLE